MHNFDNAEEYTVFDLHAEFFDELSKLPSYIFENSDEYIKVKAELRNAKSADAVIGEKYIYASVSSTPAAIIANVAFFKKMHELVGMKGEKYHFSIDGTTRTFPEHVFYDFDNSFKTTFLFNSETDFGKFMSRIQMRLSPSSGWNLSFKNTN